tara:strand:- start:750 stop:1103 length:354 start_codon:yes stop_codon:yes gene_type:complete
MKHTYIKIYNQARQEVGLPGPSPEEAAVAEDQARSIIELARSTMGELADGNPNGSNYISNSPFWKFPYNCAPDSDPWLYPISAENGLFFTDLTGPGFSDEQSPCGGGPLEEAFPMEA